MSYTGEHSDVSIARLDSTVFDYIFERLEVVGTIMTYRT